MGRAPGGVGMEVRSAAFQDKEKSIIVLELMAPLASRKVFGLRTISESCCTGQGENWLWFWCVEQYLTIPPSPGCSRKGRAMAVSEGCVLSRTAECSVRNVQETNPAIAHAAFIPQTALCCCKLALFIKCIYLAADLLLHMNN